MKDHFIHSQKGAQKGNMMKQNKISRSLSMQIGGDHYNKMKIQPVEFIHSNNIPFIEGAIIKYVVRHRDKGGIQDLRKAQHFLQMLIDLEYGDQVIKNANPVLMDEYDPPVEHSWITDPRSKAWGCHRCGKHVSKCVCDIQDFHP